jgi:glucokinase
MAEEVVALLGDIGGTNIRLEMVVINSHSNQPTATLSKATYLVADYEVFQDALITFLQTSERHPVIAVLGVAGPIVNNTVAMANVPKWQTIDANKLGENLKIKYFSFINDFEAASYGVLIVPETDFISLNGKKVNEAKLRGIMGPGTGLGNSTIYPATIKQHR